MRNHINQVRAVQAGIVSVHADAPGASNISLDVQVASSGYGYGMGGYDPLRGTLRLFWFKMYLGVAAVGLAVANMYPTTFSGLMMHLSGILMALTCAMSAVRLAYDHYRLRTGAWGFMGWLAQPEEWWPDRQEAQQDSTPPGRPGSSSRLPGASPSYRMARAKEGIRNALYRLQQLPRRAWCAAFGRQVPAPAGTLRLTHERRNTLNFNAR